MSKEVEMTIRVEPELRAEFMQASARQHRPAAQVLRELMRAYIDGASISPAPPANDAGLSPAERRRREDAWAFARASVGLEGFTPSEAVEHQASRVIQGDITVSEFVQSQPEAVPPGR